MICVSFCPARPDERNALNVFVSPRRLADEHQIGVRIADAEDDLLPAERAELAPHAVADVLANGREVDCDGLLDSGLWTLGLSGSATPDCRLLGSRRPRSILPVARRHPSSPKNLRCSAI